MRTYSFGEIKARVESLGYKWFDDQFNIIGIRSREDQFNKFDDSMNLIWNQNRILNGYIFSCTTNPGASWLQEKMNPKGCAVLKPGQYIDSWALGKHRGVYEALVQVKPVIVCRDKDKDQKSECNGVEEKGLFGINIHRANEGAISPFINLWSAGCQVLNNPAQYEKFIRACKLSKQKVFTYTLLEEW